MHKCHVYMWRIGAEYADVLCHFHKGEHRVYCDGNIGADVYSNAGVWVNPGTGYSDPSVG